MKIEVSFSAGEVAKYTGNLNIFNNSASNPVVEVTLSGEGILPPVITVTPDSLFANLLSTDSVNQKLTIGNITGGSELITNISVVPKVTTSFSRDKSTDVIRSNRLDTEFYDEKLTGSSNEVSINNTKPIPYYEGFESGSLTEWDNNGQGIIETTTIGPAKGKRSLRIKNTTGGHFKGLHQTFNQGSQPKYISSYIKSGSMSLADAYLVFSDQAGREVIWFFATENGTLYVNADVGGDKTYQYETNIWYHIEFKDIDWIDKDFDYYVNGELVKADIPFRNSSNVNDISNLYLYNYHNSEAWWDEITVGENLSWLTTEKLDLIIDKGMSDETGVIMNATGLVSGLYEADILLNSNDPAQPVVRVPVSMNVTAIPDISVTPSSIDFGEVFVSHSVDSV